MVETADSIWADGPSGSPFQPPKPKIRAWGKWIEGVISAFLGNSGLVYTSRAALYANLAHAANSSAWVIGDATVAYNGVYVKSGASGTGSWTRVSDLPFSFIIANDAGAGTPNAKQATTSLPVSGSALVWMTIAATNTGTPVTVQFNGGAVLTVKTNAGNNPVAGGLVAGMTVMGIISGSTFRLLSDQASAAIISVAEGYALAAQAAAAGVTLPSAVASTYLRQKADLTGYETRTPTQVVSDLNVQPLNIDNGFSMSATTTQQDWGGYFGGGWKTAHRFYSSDTGPLSGSRATAVFFRQVNGTGEFGPDRSDAAIWMEVAKFNPYTNLTQGEINGFIISARQGAYGDVSGGLMDVEKVMGTEAGGLGLETAVKGVDTAGAVVQRTQSIVNFGVEGATGLSGGKGYGYWTERQRAAGYSAYHADQSQTSTGAAWQNFITFAKDRTTLIYSVDGNGRTYAGNSSAAVPAYSFTADQNTGMYRVAEDQLGFSAGGALRAYIAASGIVPGTDNSLSLGVPATGRWANIYSVNSVTVGSDEKLKTDIIESPLGLDFIELLNPKSYRLKVGGVSIEWEDEEIDVEEPVTQKEWVLCEKRSFDGVKEVIEQTAEYLDVPVMERLPVLDKDGNAIFEEINEVMVAEDGLPIMELVEQEPRRFRTQDGEVHEEYVPPIWSPKKRTVSRQAFMSVPKMQTVKKTVPRPVEKEVEGRRPHFGFIAQEVKAALDRINEERIEKGLTEVDFGGWGRDDVNDPESLQWLRLEQFMAPLVKSVQTLAAQNRDLIDRIVAIEGQAATARPK